MIRRLQINSRKLQKHMKCYLMMIKENNTILLAQLETFQQGKTSIHLNTVSILTLELEDTLIHQQVEEAFPISGLLEEVCPISSICSLEAVEEHLNRLLALVDFQDFQALEIKGQNSQKTSMNQRCL